MTKKAKTLEVKLRSAIRLIWSRSAERRAILKQAEKDFYLADHMDKTGYFKCPICAKEWPIQMAEVDHEPPVGPLPHWRGTVSFIEAMFFGPQQVICKICHKKKTARQRKQAK